MIAFTHQILSKKSTPEVWQCECEYCSRSATVSVAVLRMGKAEVVFIQPGGKLDTIVTWCLAKNPTSRWDVAVTNGHCSRTVFPLTPPETQKLAVWEPSVQWAEHFVQRIARIWTRLTWLAIWGALFSRHSAIIKVSSQLTKWRERLSKAWQKLPHGAVIANSSLLSPFYLRSMLIARWRHYFPRMIQVNYGMCSKWRDRNLCQIW